MAKIEVVLAECLDALERGASLETCLARYPEQRTELEPLLRAAWRVRSTPPVATSHAFRERARDRMVHLLQHRQAAATRHERSERVGFLRWLQTQFALDLPFRRFAMPALASLLVILLVGLLGAGAAYASSDALPGDSLYPVKLASEQIRLALSLSESAKAALHLRLAAERLEEASVLIQTDGADGIAPLMKRYAAEVNAASGILRRRRDRDSQVADLSTELQEELTRHQTVLSQVREAVPPAARAAVESALAASEAARQGALGPEERPEGSPMVRPTRPGQPQGETRPPTSTHSLESTVRYTPTQTTEPDQRSEPSERAVPPGRTMTPDSPGRTYTPEPPGQTYTPQPPGRTYTPAPPAQTPTPRGPEPGATPEPPGPPDPPDPPGPPDPPDPPGENERPGETPGRP